jgi:hypothetical protein
MALENARNLLNPNGARVSAYMSALLLIRDSSLKQQISLELRALNTDIIALQNVDVNKDSL